MMITSIGRHQMFIKGLSNMTHKKGFTSNFSFGRQKSAGFTLAEVLVVALILGVLALATLPSFTQFLNRYYVKNDLTNLMGIYSAQLDYFNNNYGAYCAIDNNCGGNVNSLNSNLHLTLPTTSPGTNTPFTERYSCVHSVPGPINKPRCHAEPSLPLPWDLVITLTEPITTITPVYCGGAPSTLGAANPCCADLGHGNPQNTPCP